eukprot:gene16044-33716_t
MRLALTARHIRNSLSGVEGIADHRRYVRRVTACLRRKTGCFGFKGPRSIFSRRTGVKSSSAAIAVDGDGAQAVAGIESQLMREMQTSFVSPMWSKNGALNVPALDVLPAASAPREQVADRSMRLWSNGKVVAQTSS